MQLHENVKYTKTLELVLLLISTILIFLGLLFALSQFIVDLKSSLLLAVVLTISYVILIIKKFIVKTSDFKLTNKRLEWDKNTIDFTDIKYYKIHWIKGAGIKFKLKCGKVIRLSCNGNFCDSKKFVNLCREVDSKLEKIEDVIRKKSFLETRWGFYFAIVMTVLFLVVLISKLINKDESNTGNIGLMLAGLITIWSGVLWYKK